MESQVIGKQHGARTRKRAIRVVSVATEQAWSGCDFVSSRVMSVAHYVLGFAKGVIKTPAIAPRHDPNAAVAVSLVLATGFMVFLGIALILAKLPWRLMLRALHHTLALDLGVTVITLFLHWGTFAGVMAATARAP